MKLTQGCFSFLPDLTDEQITKQIQYAIDKSWAISIEFSVVTERARLLDVFFDVRNKYCAVRHAADSGGFDSQTPACSMIRRSERTWLRLRAVPEASASGRLNALWSDDRCKSR
jgi:hypothetical protein